MSVVMVMIMFMSEDFTLLDIAFRVTHSVQGQGYLDLNSWRILNTKRKCKIYLIIKI